MLNNISWGHQIFYSITRGQDDLPFNSCLVFYCIISACHLQDIAIIKVFLSIDCITLSATERPSICSHFNYKININNFCGAQQKNPLYMFSNFLYTGVHIVNPDASTWGPNCERCKIRAWDYFFALAICNCILKSQGICIELAHLQWANTSQMSYNISEELLHLQWATTFLSNYTSNVHVQSIWHYISN